MNADVEKAADRMDACLEITEPQHTVFCGDKDTYLTIRQALRDQEAEIARLRVIEEERWSVVATRNAAVERAEQAEALLRECHRVLSKGRPLHARITAHLGAEQ